MMYILKDKKPIKMNDTVLWAKWFESNNREVCLTKLSGDVRVSTAFLGVDHQFFEGPPLLFETLVLGGALDGEIERYSTWQEAEKGHKEMVSRALKCRTKPKRLARKLDNG